VLKLNEEHIKTSGIEQGFEGLPSDCDGWMINGNNRPCNECDDTDCPGKNEAMLDGKLTVRGLKKLRERINKN
jgi:hypothetical protein